MVPEFSIGRNILLGGEGGLAKRGRLSNDERRTVGTALAKVGASFDPDTKTSSLSVPHLRLAQIARALVHPGEIMILDEPTAVLSEPDAELLIERVMQFRSEGKAVLYVTHRLSEVIRMADRITILRDGKRVGSFLRGEVSRQDIVQLMTKDVAAWIATRRRTCVAHDRALAVPIGSFRSATFRWKNNYVCKPHCLVRPHRWYRRRSGARVTAIFFRSVAGVDATTTGEIILDGHQLPLGSVRHAVQQDFCWYRRTVAELRLLPLSVCAIARSSRGQRSPKRRTDRRTRSPRQRFARTEGVTIAAPRRSAGTNKIPCCTACRTDPSGQSMTIKNDFAVAGGIDTGDRTKKMTVTRALNTGDAHDRGPTRQ